ncbi:MAG: hypothetical protein RMX55_07910 [Planktomarina sp.]|nr:hypothetical protein [Planktomarina sp.]
MHPATMGAGLQHNNSRMDTAARFGKQIASLNLDHRNMHCYFERVTLRD